MRLPLVVSVPHAGVTVPAQVESLCMLSAAEIEEDSDGGADEIYSFEPEAGAFVSTDVARVIVDMNRARHDRRPDGAVKTHSCWNVPVYREPLTDVVVESLLDAYHAPYHDRLSALGRSELWPLGVDCHTMSAVGPTLGPDPGHQRPWICLSHADRTCPQEWIEALQVFFAEQLAGPVTINDPFTGGHITRSHATEMPWIQIEVSREPFMPLDAKRHVVLSALQRWADHFA